MRLRWTEDAVQDLTTICDYIAEHGSPKAARNVALSVHRGLDLLAHFPEHGRTGRKTGTRELVFSGLPYLAIYRIAGETIEILRILQGAQRWP